MLESVLLMFSSTSLIVSGFSFRSLIHLEFIPVYGVKKCSSCIILQVVNQFSQHYLFKRLSFLHCIFLPTLSKIRYPCVHGFSSVLSSLFYNSVFVPIKYCLDDCGFVVDTEVSQVDSSSYSLLSQDYFGYLRFFIFPYQLWNYWSNFLKNTVVIFMGISLNLYMTLGCILIFTIFILPIHEHVYFSIYLCPLWFLSPMFCVFLYRGLLFV